ncbi:type 1 glutamine amidotransferase [Halomonas sp. 18H]|uniref:type 1 glutamine amidotransferase n=1 Tax=Halomonas almeriensis TaxID=308163 RepID=UPI002231F3B1|nr:MULTISPECIES: type 1 glutamine amidotransferase [Halomonas]MCW4152965.1 type 1 glutamine amidotransferase [Halomonas sp. 18H]MDN3553107.1 type 1 glutamine amidotransferase [Halomonas almeriensis]
MHFHLLQHSPHQGPARIADWLDSMGHSHTVFHLHDGELTPKLKDADGLIVLDGPEERQVDPAAPWPRPENKLIDRALDGRKPLLGVGYGARRIAEALGAVVSGGTHAERGWHRVHLAPQSPFDLPEVFEAFMWHRDIFALPEEALPLGGSEASPMQGFSWDAHRVIGLLCHLEATPASVESMLAHRPALDSGPYVQSRPAMLDDARRFDRQAPLLDRLLSQWLASVPR